MTDRNSLADTIDPRVTDSSADSDKLDPYYTVPTRDLIAASDALRMPLPAALRSVESDGWMPIETAPKMKVVLLFAVSDVDHDGAVRNWKMATGCFNTGYADDEKWSPWEWDGRQLREYDLQPTHWRPLPPSPAVTGE